MISKYTNQANVGINDMLRLTFRETQDGNHFEDIITLAMHLDFAEIMCNTVMDTIKNHKKNIENQKATLNVDKELN